MKLLGRHKDMIESAMIRINRTTNSDDLECLINELDIEFSKEPAEVYQFISKDILLKRQEFYVEPEPLKDGDWVIITHNRLEVDLVNGKTIVVATGDHRDFAKDLEFDIEEAFEQGREVVEYYLDDSFGKIYVKYIVSQVLHSNEYRIYKNGDSWYHEDHRRAIPTKYQLNNAMRVKN